MICCDTYCMVSPYSWTQEAYDTVASYLKYDMLWYVLHDTTVFIMRIISPGIRWYHVIRITTYHILNTMAPYHTHPKSMNTVVPCNTYHNISYFKYDAYNMICCDAYYMVPSYSWTEDAYDTVALYIKYDMLRYVLHGTTVFMDLVCAWYSGIVFKIWYVAIRITCYYRIHELRMCMIQWHRI
jgi:hypothetical protein